jgi:response regulator of citrate/malate metabolism
MCDLLSEIVGTFYTWGNVLAFTDPDEATFYCQNQATGVAIFILDVFLDTKTGFDFLDAVERRFPMAYQDTIIITGNASEDVVNMCLESDITYLLEKPIRSFALQFAIRAIVAKYTKFARRLLVDPIFAESIARV